MSQKITISTDDLLQIRLKRLNPAFKGHFLEKLLIFFFQLLQKGPKLGTCQAQEFGRRALIVISHL